MAVKLVVEVVVVVVVVVAMFTRKSSNSPNQRFNGVLDPGHFALRLRITCSFGFSLLPVKDL